MEDVVRCIERYAELAEYTYTFRLETNEEFTLLFAEEHLFHLLGLHKLRDLEGFSGQKRKTQVIRRIKAGKLTQAQIEKSQFYSSIQNRVAHFPFIDDLLRLETCNLIIDFDKTKVKPYSGIEATYILYRELSDGIIHLTLAKDQSGALRPQSFLFEKGRRYIDRQKKYPILEIIAARRPP